MGELREDFLPQLSKGDNGLVHDGFGFAQHRVKLDAPSQSLKRTWVLNTRSVKKTSLTVNGLQSYIITKHTHSHTQNNNTGINRFCTNYILTLHT